VTAPTIVDPGYSPPDGAFTLRTATSITDFIVHHSAGPTSQTPLEIDAFERGNGDIFMPYTWLIAADGTIFSGRPPSAMSAATYGRNAQSVACCLIGNFQQDDAGYTGQPTTAQMASLTSLCIWAHRQYPTIERTIAHGDVAALFYGGSGDYATACCGSWRRPNLSSNKITCWSGALTALLSRS